jgi:hypothetical protein
MKYFKITSEKEADTLSRTMYKMMYPANASVTTTHLFSWKTNDKGECIIEVDTNDMPVYKKSDYAKTLEKIDTITTEVTTKETKDEMDKGRINPTKLLNGLEEVEYQYLLDNGFIKESKMM